MKNNTKKYEKKFLIDYAHNKKANLKKIKIKAQKSKHKTK